MRKLLRALAKAKMKAQGYAHPNKQMVSASGRAIWRDVVGAHPGFKGQAHQRKGSKQRTLSYEGFLRQTPKRTKVA